MNKTVCSRNDAVAITKSGSLVTTLDLTHLWPWIKIGAEKLKTKIAKSNVRVCVSNKQ